MNTHPDLTLRCTVQVIGAKDTVYNTSLAGDRNTCVIGSICCSVQFYIGIKTHVGSHTASSINSSLNTFTTTVCVMINGTASDVICIFLFQNT